MEEEDESVEVEVELAEGEEYGGDYLQSIVVDWASRANGLFWSGSADCQNMRCVEEMVYCSRTDATAQDVCEEHHVI